MVSRLLTRPVRLARTAAAWAGGQLRRQFITQNRRMAAVLTVATVGIGVATVHLSEWWFSPGMLILPVLAGGLLLWPRALRILFGVVALTLVYDALYHRAGAGIIATVVITGVFADVLARTRWKLGVQGLRGDRMLIELRDRLRAQGRMPPLPTGWRSAAVLRPAGGSSFGGDFLVSTCDGKTLEVALVDVSGKGVDAGTRALLLSGAFGGLLGSVPQGEFLTACNAYLRRGPVTEGFVTAVHLALDLTTGDYVLTSAGHPPPAQFDAGSGTWKVTSGPRHRARRRVRPALRAGPWLAPARGRADAVYRWPGGGAGPGHRRGHRPAARRGHPAGRVELPGRGGGTGPGGQGRRWRRQRRLRPGDDLADVIPRAAQEVSAGSPSLARSVRLRSTCSECSTSAISASRQDGRCRASHITTGIRGSRSSADRTDSPR